MKELTILIMKALQLKEPEVEVREKLGGMTNLNYLVLIHGEQYVARMPGRGTGDFINRKEEKENLELSASLGINPELFYFDVETGLKITEKVRNAKTLTLDIVRSEKMMTEVTAIFRKLHYTDKKMANRFELFELMDKYERLALKENVHFFKGFEEVKGKVLSLKEDYDKLNITEVPCHIDPTYGNFITGDKDEVYLIDWEYSGMFDPLWDLSAHSLESNFSKSEEALFLKLYFQRDVTQLEMDRILMHKIFQDYLWSLWTLFKEAKGDDFGAYGENRFERAKENLTVYDG